MASRPWPPNVSRGVPHAEQPLYKETGHLPGRMPMLQMPVDDAGLFDIRSSDGPDIPEFDPRVHLDLSVPAYSERLGDFDRIPPFDVSSVNTNRGSEFAFTAPFRLLSDEGVRVLRKVLSQLTPKKTHRSYQYRGLYYASPFVRSLCNDPSLLAHLGRLVGEPVHVHHLLMDAAFANVARENEEAVVAGTADPWHFDSCTYVAVTLLSSPMKGGDLQIVRRGRDDALHRIAETRNQLDEGELVTVDYQEPGNCILVQGSEIVHRVTPVVESPTGEPRIALGLGLVPASPFRWDKTNLDTFAKYDGLTAASFEFFRLKAHALGHALTELARAMPSSSALSLDSRGDLARKLRSVSTELDRVAALVETENLPANDFVGFVDESQLRADVPPLKEEKFAPASSEVGVRGFSSAEGRPGPVGICGLGIMGTAMARNLLQAGYPVVVFNRSPSKCAELVSEGAMQAPTAKAVVEQCALTIGMVSDPDAALALALGPDGVVEGISAGKGYVDMSTVDVATSKAIADAVTSAGGRFVEAPVSGSKGPAIAGQLVILAAGDESLYEEAAPLFDVMGKKRLHLGEVGRGAQMKLIVNMVMGSMQSAFSEGLGLTAQCGLKVEDFLDVVGAGAMSCPMFQLKGPLMAKGDYTTAFPLKHAQKDMRLALALGDAVNQPMPVAAAANEAFKAARAAGHGDADFSAVHLVTTRK